MDNLWCEHKCPSCGHTCLYDRAGHRCTWCRHVHSGEVYTPLPLDLHIPGPDPEPCEELVAAVVVAEIHALRNFKLVYHEYHRSAEGHLHFVVQFGRNLMELKATDESDIAYAWDYFKGYLTENGIFGMGRAA